MCVTYQYSASMKRFFPILFILYCCNLFAMAPKLNWDKAIDKAIKRYGLRVEPQLISYFSKAGVSYPPKEIALLAFKSERKVELWAKNPNQEWTHIHDYPLTGFSGRLGPKLRENDKQIPEGIYKLVNFNPFSSMHLSMMINYPNSFDRQKGYMDGRKELGNNIFIHGKNLSVGCLAVGDLAIDQLFILARRVGLKNIQVIIAPNDLRYQKPSTSTFAQPRWLPELYKQITESLKPFKKTKFTA
ncbi:TPA: lipoprotein [Legionella pneumophila]|uniref:Lipoprotein n=5 Tax=Legionella pneumophila TaxID=446 RepID=Q5ZVC6_LEGPH|nr:lipoprotein [Legionella pneumophila subsp. pneumophila str. Philadelphia 1]AEW51717.1 lipoprotein [Legionella pneumophila subsp. pneumophila ATCC 43290]AGN14403.1 lipoprotein [Legionella pneumophila subsp. pneumophila str. Thunder Bay]OOK41052.1 lipoprotein [Legionella pneumophila subsp. pneumophila str. Sudbury]PNL78120.1 lipoprotein [Legionella pneumophila subsp. pneumophila]PPK33231.1 lipoprotein [Legionella pneumophila]